MQITTTTLRRAGIIAGLLLVVMGIGSIAVGYDSRDRVRDELAREQIVGTPDSTIPNQKVDTGSEAQAMAAIIRKHTLEATGGQTYAEMGRFLDANGKPTSDEAAAAKDEKTGRAVENPARNIWISSTAFQSALNTAYFAESVALFVMAFGAAMLLIGIGLTVLALKALKPAGSTSSAVKTTAVPAAS